MAEQKANGTEGEMFMAHFYKSHTKRYDDPEEMVRDIAEFLRLNPKRSVKVEYYTEGEEMIAVGKEMVVCEKHYYSHYGEFTDCPFCRAEKAEGEVADLMKLNEELVEILRRLDYTLKTVHLDMGGRPLYSITHKGHDVISELKALLSERYSKEG